MGVVDGAADRHGGAQHLLDGARQVGGARPVPHLARHLDDVLQGDVARVLDVLGLLAVADGLLQGLDDQGGGRGHDLDLGLAVLDDQLDRDAQALPVLGRLLGDILTNLLTQKTYECFITRGQRSERRRREGKSTTALTRDPSPAEGLRLPG